MSAFRVELKKVVDDSYDIQVGFHLEEALAADIAAGLVGRIRKFAVVTDSIVKELHAEKIASLLRAAGYDGAISLEGSDGGNFESAVAEAISVMREAEKNQ